MVVNSSCLVCACESRFTEVDATTDLKALFVNITAVVLVVPLIHSANIYPPKARQPASCVLNAIEVLGAIDSCGLLSPSVGVFVMCSKQDLYDEFTETNGTSHLQHPIQLAQFSSRM
jgi:hypothetical protein